MRRIGTRARQDGVRARIAPYLEPLPAARTVLPQFIVWAGGIVAKVDERHPCGFGRISARTLHRRVATVGEFALRPRAAPRTWDQQHGSNIAAINVPTASVPRPSRRSFLRGRNARA